LPEPDGPTNAIKEFLGIFRLILEIASLVGGNR